MTFVWQTAAAAQKMCLGDFASFCTTTQNRVQKTRLSLVVSLGYTKEKAFVSWIFNKIM